MRSPTCRYCFTRGHTRRSCPLMKEQAAAAAAKLGHERTRQESWALNQVQDAAYAAKNRSCSYCAGKGHNTKGCTTRKTDMVNATTALVKWREDFLHACKEAGFGVGAVLSWSGYDYDNKCVGVNYVVVKSLVKNLLNHWTHHRGQDPTTMSAFEYGYAMRPKLERPVLCDNLQDIDGKGYKQVFVLPNEVIVKMWSFDYIKEFLENNNRYYQTKLVCPVPAVLGFDESEFVSREACYALVEERFSRFGYRGQPSTRAGLVNDRVLVA